MSKKRKYDEVSFKGLFPPEKPKTDVEKLPSVYPSNPYDLVEVKPDEFFYTADELRYCIKSKTDTTKTYIVMSREGVFMGGIYHDEKDGWVMFETIFSCYSIDNEHLDRIMRLFDGWEIQELNSYEDMCSFIRELTRQGIFYELVTSSDHNSAKWLVDKVAGDLGKVIRLPDEKEYVLVGLSSTMEDYYYVTLGSDNELHLHSCVGDYDVVDMSGDEVLRRFPAKDRIDDLKDKLFNNPRTLDVPILTI